MKGTGKVLSLLLAVLPGWFGCEGEASSPADKPAACKDSGQAGGGAQGAIEAACRTFFRRQKALIDSCNGHLEGAEHEDEYTRACAALAGLPGVTATAASIEACAAEFEGRVVCAMPSCVRTGALLIPIPAGPGTLAVGATCQSRLQCASGDCSAYEELRCGVCREVRKLGESCGRPDQVCEGSGKCVGGICNDGTSGEGGGCSRHGAFMYCGSLFNCAEQAPGAGEVCKRRPGLGEACDERKDIDCERDLACEAGVCVERLPDGASCGLEGVGCLHQCNEGTCQQRQTDRKQGESCGFHGCEPGLVCGDDTCVALVPAGEGEPCKFVPCKPGLFCTAEQACSVVAPVGEGEPCQASPCGPGLVCGRGDAGASTPGVCMKKPGVGRPCVDLECDADSRCAESSLPDDPGTCLPLGREGEGCPCIRELICSGSVCRAPCALACP